MHSATNLLVLPNIENIDEIIGENGSTINLTKGHFYNLEFRFKNNNAELLLNGMNIKDFSSVWLSSFWRSRDLAYAVKLYLDHFKTPHTYVEKSTSKITDQLYFVFNDILTPDLFFVDTPDITKYIEKIEDICSYPLIIKDIKGSRGLDSAFIRNREELMKQLLDLPKNKKYLFQKFVPNEFEWGVMVVNGNVVSAEKSYPKGDEFRNNAKGTKEVYVAVKDIPKIISIMAIKASKALRLSWCRCDILVDKYTEIPYLLEVNRCPGITSGTSEVRGAQTFLKTYLESISQ